MTSKPIVVGRHTITRLRERSPELPFPDPVHVRCEVAAALREGRHSVRRPAFLSDEGRGPRSRGATFRFVWSRDRSRCYVLRVRSNVIVVMTVLTPEPEGELAVA